MAKLKLGLEVRKQEKIKDIKKSVAMIEEPALETFTVTDEQLEGLKPKERLEFIIPMFFTENTEMNKHKKDAEKRKKDIKEILTEMKLEEFTVGDLVAKLQKKSSVGFNEEALIEILKPLKIRGLIKRREYVDMDMLEDKIYKELIDAAILAPAQEEKKSIALTVKKKKPVKDK